MAWKLGYWSQFTDCVCMIVKNNIENCFDIHDKFCNCELNGKFGGVFFNNLFTEMYLLP